MPAGTGSVAMQEDVRVAGDAVALPAGLKTGANRRLAREDMARGNVAVRPGARLGPRHLALVAAPVRRDLPVRIPLKVAPFSTGDELTPPATPCRQPASTTPIGRCSRHC